MSLKHAKYMAEMKRRQAEREAKEKQGSGSAVNTKPQTTVKMRRHRLPR